MRESTSGLSLVKPWWEF